MITDEQIAFLVAAKQCVKSAQENIAGMEASQNADELYLIKSGIAADALAWVQKLLHKIG